MAKLLFDEQPLLILPELASKIGLNESIVLQQVHYWINISKKSNQNYRDGYYWVYNSIERWQDQFPFWSTRTIKRIIGKLESEGILVSGNYNRLKIDRTKWYRIDYEQLEYVANPPLGQSDTIIVTDCRNLSDEVSQPLPESNTEINSYNDYLHDSENHGCIFHLNKYCLTRFGKPLRAYYRDYDLTTFEDMSLEEFYEILDDSIKTYDQCNLDYLEHIQDRFR